MKAIAEFFKNKAGQFSIEEVTKFLAFLAAVFIEAAFLFTGWIEADKGTQVHLVAVALLTYALGQGISHNATGQ